MKTTSTGRGVVSRYGVESVVRKLLYTGFHIALFACAVHPSIISAMPRFQAPTWTSIGISADGFVVADLNGDGFPDVAIRDSNGVRILRNNQVSGFTTQQISTPSYSDRTLALGDVDGDGDVDIAVSSREQSSTQTWVYLYLNNGSGLFASSAQFLLMYDYSAHCRRLRFSYVNGDAILDLVGAVDGGTTDLGLIVLPGTSPGQFGAAQRSDVPNSPTGQWDSAGDFVITDVNGDGKKDAVCANTNSITLMNGTGTGNFTHPGPTGFLNLGQISLNLGVGDADGDGRVDIAVAGGTDLFYPYRPASSQLLYGLSNTLSGALMLDSAAGSDTCVSMGDLDNDGDADVVVGHDPWTDNQAHITIFDSTESGLLPPDEAGRSIMLSIRYSLWNYEFGRINDLLIADMNADGWLDLLVLYSDGSHFVADSLSFLGVLLSEGDGSVTAPAINLAGNLNFGPVAVGSSAQLTLAITNPGGTDLSVTGISYPAGFSGNWSSDQIAAGGSRNVTVTFSPAAVQGYGGNIVVSSNATSGNGSLSVSGAGIVSTGPPPTPTGVWVERPTSSTRILRWNDVASETGYQVEKMTKRGWGSFATLGPDVTAVNLSGKRNLNANYRINAFNGFGTSAPTATYSVK